MALPVDGKARANLQRQRRSYDLVSTTVITFELVMSNTSSSACMTPAG